MSEEEKKKKLREYNTLWKYENRERIKASRTPEAKARHKVTAKLWKESNKEHIKEYNAGYGKRLRTEDPERYKRYYTTQNAKRYARYPEVRLAAIVAYGGECACCGEDEPKFLAFDHKNGGGNKERKKASYGGMSFLESLLKTKREDIRILCHNCNLARGFYGQCPHELKDNE